MPEILVFPLIPEPPKIVTLSLATEYGIYNKSSLTTLLSRAETATIAILDLTRTSYIDCSCLGALIALLKKMRFRNGDAELRLAGASKHIAKILALCELDTIFSMYATMQEALIGPKSGENEVNKTNIPGSR